ncbi:hypothetical protein ACFX19_025481 [Malus domestica]
MLHLFRHSTMAGFQLGPDDSESRAAPPDLVSDVDSTAAEISPQNSTPHDRRHEESSSAKTRLIELEQQCLCVLAEIMHDKEGFDSVSEINSERVPSHTNVGQKNTTAAMLPFNNERTLLSKSEDAGRWILSLVQGDSVVRPAYQQTQRRPKSDLGFISFGDDQKNCPLCRTPFISKNMQGDFNKKCWAATGTPPTHHLPRRDGA